MDVVEKGETNPRHVIKGHADLRTDLPKYNVYENGVLTQTDLLDATEIWRDDLVSFLLGCSFTFEAALVEEGFSIRNVEEKKNVSMYRTNLKTRDAGVFKDINYVVSMRPFKAVDVVKVVEITRRYPNAHGAPIHVGSPSQIGIDDITQPDFGDYCEVKPDEVCVFWACGVTTAEAVKGAKIEFAVTHKPGCMFVTDVKM